MANINNTSSYMDEDKKQIIKESNYTYRDEKPASSKGFIRKCKSTTFKRNLMKWAMRNSFKK